MSGEKRPPRPEPDAWPEVEAVERTGGHVPLGEAALGDESVLLESMDEPASPPSLPAPPLPQWPEAPPPPVAAPVPENDRTEAYDPPAELFADIPDPEAAPLPRPAVVGPAAIHEKSTAFMPALVRPAAAPPASTPPPATPAPVPEAPRRAEAPKAEPPKKAELKKAEPKKAPPPAEPKKRPAPAPPAQAAPRRVPEPLREIPSPDDDEPTRDPADDEMTGVYQPPPVVELPRGRLVIVGGENAGKIYYLNRNRAFLGRGTDNDVVLLDIAVSRRHLRIDRHGHGFRLTDLQSGNGTFVNGRRVTEAELYDGDRVELGNILLDFSTVGRARKREDVPERHTDPGRATPPVINRRPVPIAWLLLWTTTTFAAVLLALFVTRMMTGNRAEPDAAARAKAREYVERSEAAMRERDWKRAEEELEVARSLGEELALGYPDRIARIQEEQANARRMEEARRLVETGAAPEDLQRVLEPVGEKSTYHAEAQQLLVQARTQALERRAKAAEALLAKGRSEGAQQVAEGVLAQDATQPTAKAVVAAVEASAREVTPASDIARRVTAPEEVDDRRARTDQADALRLYRDQRFSDAALAFERALRRGPSPKLAAEIKSRARAVQAFAEANAAAEGATRSRRFGEAISNYERAQELDRKLGNAHRSRIDQQLADLYYQQAIQAFSRQNYSDAVAQNARVLRLAPGHALGTKLAEKMQRTAGDLLRRARQAADGDPDQARRLARSAQAMAPAADPVHDEALALLKKLGD